MELGLGAGACELVVALLLKYVLEELSGSWTATEMKVEGSAETMQLAVSESTLEA